MKTYPMPLSFSGAKFAARYGLNALRGDFFSDGVNLHVPDGLPDDPPIFEPPDPVVDLLAALKAAIDAATITTSLVTLKAVLQEWRKTLK